MSVVGAVVIGRNEGDRLVSCLSALSKQLDSIVYVDSNSTDGSVANAQQMGVVVVELDMSVAFTAARARNAGFVQLAQMNPEVEYVQFVDGDCVVDEGWIEKAQSFLEANRDFALTCGRRREKFPQNSVYNAICDIEWNTPIGEAKASGGDFLIRADLFKQVEGFNQTLIAGEEPELCIRLRQAGYKIMRLDAAMTMHDAAITKLSQWWKRSVRAGFAFAEGAYLYGKSSERYRLRETRRAWLWAAALPLLTIVLSVFDPRFLVCLVFYPLQVFRIALRMGVGGLFAWQYAFFSVLGKFPEMQGNLRFWVGRFSQSKSKIIEYK